jgi:hypothetical protein
MVAEDQQMRELADESAGGIAELNQRLTELAEREQRLRIARATAPEYGMGFVPPPSRPEG